MWVDAASLRLADADGDGRVEEATLSAEGVASIFTGQDILGAGLQVSSPFGLPPEPTFTVLVDNWPVDPLPPVGTITWASSVPLVPTGTVQVETALGSFDATPVEVAPGVVARYTAELPPLPWGSTVELVGDLVDLAGRPVQAGRIATIAPEPVGDPLANGSFEGPGGWYPDPIPVAPTDETVDGATVARLGEGRLVGVIEVPPAGGTLRLSVGELATVFYPPHVEVLLYDASGSTLLFGQYPDGTLLDERWVEVSEDLAPWAGETVYLAIRRPDGIAGYYSATAVDHVHIDPP